MSGENWAICGMTAVFVLSLFAMWCEEMGALRRQRQWMMRVLRRVIG